MIDYFQELATWGLEKAKHIPKGKYRNCKFAIYPFDCRIIFVNDFLRRYSGRLILKSHRSHQLNHTLVISWLSDADYARYAKIYDTIKIEFTFNVSGTSTRFLDRIRPANWRLKSSRKV